MKNPAILIIILALLSSCKTKLEYTEHSVVRPESSRQLAYKLETSEADSAKLVVLINDYPDPQDLAHSELTRFFADENYNILIPGRTESLNTKRERTWDISHLIYELDSLRQNGLVILGIGEGAYLTPEIAAQSKADKAIMINAGFNSPMHEMEAWLQSDSLSPGFKKVLNEKGIGNPDELRNRIAHVKKDPRGYSVIAPEHNPYWMSFYDKPLMRQRNFGTVPTLWVNYEGYPLLAPATLETAKVITGSFPGIVYKQYPGTGDLTDTEQMSLLITAVESFMAED